MAYERVNWENLPSKKTPINPTNLNKMDEGIANAVEKSDLLDLVYPVGSIYMSVNNTSPATLFGGTWEQIKDRFLLSCGNTYTNGAIGGESTHTLTINEMPSHSHGIRTNSMDGDMDWVPVDHKGDQRHDEIDFHWEGEVISTTGGGQPHNNMPPYLAVFMWKRIS